VSRITRVWNGLLRLIALEERSSPRQRAWTLVLLLVVAAVGTGIRVPQRRMEIVLAGWGPQQWVNEHLEPENYVDDWVNGSANYSRSAPMQTYVIAAYLGISADAFMWPFMFFQWFLYISAVVFLVRTLFDHAPTTLVALLAALTFELFGLGIALFGRGYSSLIFEIYYGYAIALALFSLTFMLRRSPLMSAAALGLAAWCHVVLAAQFGLFMLCMFPWYRDMLSEKRFRWAIGLLVLLLLPVVWSLKGAGLGVGGIPGEDWVLITRVFCRHWYPTTTLASESQHIRVIYPLLTLVALWILSLRLGKPDEKGRAVLAGCVGSVVVSLVAVWVVDHTTKAVLIKFAAHRMSSMASVFLMLFSVRYLVAQLRNTWISAAATGALLFSLAFGSPGLAFLPMFVLALVDVVQGHLGPLRLGGAERESRRTVVLLAIVFLVPSWASLVPLDPYETDVITRLLTQGGDFFFWVGGEDGYRERSVRWFAIAAIAAPLFRWLWTRRVQRGRLLALAAAAIVTCFALDLGNQRALFEALRGERARAYLEVQRWAAASTEPTALFLHDPAGGYGWRDFSHRSSLGNYREWGFTAICYDTSSAALEAGLERYRAFGVNDLLSTLRSVPVSEGEQHVAAIVRAHYLKLNSADLRALRTQFGVDFAVLPPDQAAKVGLPVRFRNEFFAVVEITSE
jgi:hypothetical protein